MTLAGGMAARCQSFGSADFNDCLSNGTLAWHLTEMYMTVSAKMDQPEMMQTAGRLFVVHGITYNHSFTRHGNM